MSSSELGQDDVCHGGCRSGANCPPTGGVPVFGGGDEKDEDAGSKVTDVSGAKEASDPPFILLYRIADTYTFIVLCLIIDGHPPFGQREGLTRALNTKFEISLLAHLVCFLRFSGHINRKGSLFI